MNHNPHNLKPGQTVILDAKYANSSEVVIHSMTPYKLYSQVYAAEDSGRKFSEVKMWDVMTKRLTPK